MRYAAMVWSLSGLFVSLDPRTQPERGGAPSEAYQLIEVCDYSARSNVLIETICWPVLLVNGGSAVSVSLFPLTSIV